MATARKTLKDSDIRTILAVFGELVNRPYDELNTFLGSITIKEMVDLNSRLDSWYKDKVLGYRYDEDLGWYDPDRMDI